MIEPTSHNEANSERDLERAYRHLLAWYPNEFRREYEPEMLDTMISAAREGQRRPDFREGLNLMISGIAMRLRPKLPQSAHTVRAAVRLMYVGAVLEALAVFVLISTIGQVRSSIFAAHPVNAGGLWNTVVMWVLIPHIVLGIAAVGLWVWLAWASGRGHDWARKTLAAMFAVLSFSVLFALIADAAVYAPVDLVLGAVLWLFYLAVLLLLFNPRSEPYFHRLNGSSRPGGVPSPVAPRSAS